MTLQCLFTRMSGHIVHMLRLWRRRRRTRQHLSNLPPYLLKDIGCSHTDWARETRLFFWQGAPRDQD